MNMDNLTFDMNEADKAHSLVEMGLFKEYLVARIKAIDKDSLNLNKDIGIVIGAIAKVTGDFIGYATEMPDVTMKQFTEQFDLAVLTGTIARALDNQGVQTAP